MKQIGKYITLMLISLTCFIGFASYIYSILTSKNIAIVMAGFGQLAIVILCLCLPIMVGVTTKGIIMALNILRNKK